MSNKKFDLIVEGQSDDPNKVAPNKLELVNLEWNHESPPDVVNLGDILLIKVGRFASPGDRYCYRLATTAKLVNGRLIPT